MSIIYKKAEKPSDGVNDMSKPTAGKKKAGIIEFDAGAKVSDYEEAARGIDEIKNGRGGSKPGKKFEATHEAILESAARLFAHKGFRGSTTRDIAVGAGVTEITLYRHFRSKEEIFFEIIRNMSLLSIAVELDNFDGSEDIETTLEQLGAKFIGIFKRRSNEFRILISETITRPELAKMFFEEIPTRGIGMIAGIMRREIEAGRFAKKDPRLYARAFIGMFLAYNLMQELFLGKERDPQDDADVAKFFTRIFLNGALKR